MDTVVYGPHGRYTYSDFYYYNETELQFGWTLNDSNDSIGFGVQFQQSGTVSGIGLYVIEYQGTPNYAMSLVTISGQAGTSGDPYPYFNHATRVHTRYSNAEWQDFNPTEVGSGWSWIDLATPVTVTKGERAALIIVPSGATVPDGSNYVEINDESTFWNANPGLWNFSTFWNHYAWEAPIAWKYADNTIQGHALVGLPWKQYNSPEEWGIEFKLPIQATCVGGVFNLYPVSPGSADAPFKLILADTSDTELASATITDIDIVGSFNNDNIHLAWDTATDPVLDANVSYRLYLKPTSSEGVDMKGFILDTESAKVGLPGGTDWKWIERSTPASGWTYKTDHYPWMSVALVDLQGEGGGGGNGGQGNSSYGFIG
jgi:hypothetical protein